MDKYGRGTLVVEDESELRQVIYKDRSSKKDDKDSHLDSLSDEFAADNLVSESKKYQVESSSSEEEEGLDDDINQPEVLDLEQTLDTVCF